MIKFSNGGILIQSASELPNVPDNCILYADFETTSGDSKLDSLNPWRNCWPLGFAITYDACPNAYYVPATLPKFTEFVSDCMLRCSIWVNHNVKYDAHVMKNSLGINPPQMMLCTVARAKIVDSDRQFKGGYALDVLCKQFFNHDITRHEKVFAPYLDGNKDYGRIPADLMAEYACDDVIANRKLDKYLDDHLPEESAECAQTEIYVTRTLWKIEQRGLRVDKLELMQKELEIYGTLAELDKKLISIVGRPFRASSSDDCFDVLCNQYGLPVLDWTENGNPSFDKEALAKYSSHPFAPAGLIETIMEYRDLDQLNAKFVRPMQTHGITDCAGYFRIHGTYNQTVTTGRSSCSDPNLQALSKKMKKFVHPTPGNVFLSTDLSQIEFRFIIHYIQNARCTADYCRNPDTDFHEWVAGMCGIHRKPAKTTNFLMGYGGGKAKLAKNLSTNMELVANLAEQVKHLPENERQREFNRLALEKGEWVYDTYHAALPELKRTARDVQRVCESRGYIRNLYGRRRYLPRDWSYKAFNNLCQSGSADMFKAMISRIDHCLETKWNDCAGLVAQTHDEPLLEVPVDLRSNPEFLADITGIMEDPTRPLRVPVRCAVGWSADNWYEASESAKPLPRQAVATGSNAPAVHI